ncbi:hypothetical protein BIU97_06215 [Curtobacterium sp. MCBA15_009]|nr:hypothetical protein BIU92_01420 [Curtobacterium sp. MCBA15_003]OII11482.1 hypothetical protein BIU97_06215 [Curtobacterium sp. MCBA15_009]OII30588.1 hypothetical protein BIU94_07475 [Curtobacterium sp. MMLR14_006]
MRKAGVVVDPASVLLVLGPAVQCAIRLPWSNHEDGSTGATALGVCVGARAAAVVDAVRRGRPDDADPPSGGRRRP